MSGLAFQMAAIIALGTFLGISLDENFPNENNIFSLILTLFSVFFSLFYMIKRIIWISKNKSK